MRNTLDFYPTPDFFTLCLKNWLSLQTHLKINTALEPFWGKGDIAKILDKVKAIITVPRYPMAVNSKTGDPQCDACNHVWVIFSNQDLKFVKPLAFYDSETLDGWKSW